MTDIKRVGDAGIHTVEGNVAGSRAARLTKEREKQQAEYESIKNKIKEENHATTNIDNKFNAATTSIEQEFAKKTIGLVSADDFRKASRELNDQINAERIKSIREKEELEQQQTEEKKKNKELKRKKIMSSLSFHDDKEIQDEENKIDEFFLLKKTKKNPNVDTSFLPDRERDRIIQEQKEALKKEWIERQEKIKDENLEVVYSYWDGSGHRKSATIKKGFTIHKFLEVVKSQLISEFIELRSTSSEDLMYVKEDLIIPHHFSFYDLIITKARGKSGPLFHFDVHDDIRLINDATIEKDESHPGKVVDRRWYEKNKHIFPASRWEIYDPNVIRDGTYTIHGGEKH
eukprot:gene6976-9536_t